MPSSAWRASGLALALVALAPATSAAAAAATVDLSGTAYEFNTPATRLAGATVRVVERPGLKATARANGAYRLKVPDRARVTPYVDAPGYHRIYLQTFTTAGRDLEQVNFQVPTDAVYQGLAALLKVPLDPATGDPRECAIVSTFSTRNVRGVGFGDFVAYGAHGVAGATAFTTPGLPTPFYFNEKVIPDPAQPRSSKDGGVIWTGVPAGRYVVRARHPRTRFASFVASCRPGRVVNANPPWGLHQLGLANRTRLKAAWSRKDGRTRLRSLRAARLPAKATVRVQSAGFPTRTVRNPGTSLTRAFPARLRLRAGGQVKLRVSAPRYDGIEVTWTARAKGAPRSRVVRVPLGD